MKNLIKYIGIALIAMSLLSFACEKDAPEPERREISN